MKHFVGFFVYYIKINEMKLSYSNSIFQFSEIETPEIIVINDKKFLKIGVFWHEDKPIVQDLQDNGAIYCYDPEVGLCFVNSSWAHLLQTMKKLDIYADKIKRNYIKYIPQFKRVNTNLMFSEEAFNTHILPHLSKLPNKKTNFYEIFVSIVEKFDFSKSWAEIPTYVYRAYKKWVSDGSFNNMWQKYYLYEKELGIKISVYKEREKAQNICNLLKKLKKQIHKIDKTAYQIDNSFWINVLFRYGIDFYAMFALEKPCPFDDPDLMNFAYPIKKQKGSSINPQDNEDDLPF